MTTIRALIFTLSVLMASSCGTETVLVSRQLSIEEAITLEELNGVWTRSGASVNLTPSGAFSESSCGSQGQLTSVSRSSDEECHDRLLLQCGRFDLKIQASTSAAGCLPPGDHSCTYKMWRVAGTYHLILNCGLGDMPEFVKN